jgi:hypothetical protein
MFLSVRKGSNCPAIELAVPGMTAQRPISFYALTFSQQRPAMPIERNKKDVHPELNNHALRPRG